jgi:hypothetical protein
MHKGYLDNIHRIIWEKDPRAYLSSFSYQHLLAVASPTNADSAGTSAAETRLLVCLCGSTGGACSAITNAVPTAGIAGSPLPSGTGVRTIPVEPSEQTQHVHAAQHPPRTIVVGTCTPPLESTLVPYDIRWHFEDGRCSINPADPGDSHTLPTAINSAGDLHDGNGGDGRISGDCNNSNIDGAGQ